MEIRGFSLNETTVKDSYLTNANQLEKEYLLKLDADRLLAGFYEIAGKEKKQERYTGGWEDQDIAGHTMGHYMTALAQVVAATGDKRFLARLEHVLDSLEECQMINGYLSAFPEELFDNLEQGKQAWVPWYTMHKVLSGLINAYQLTKLPAALNIALRLGSWVCTRVNRWDEAMKTKVLGTEYGGMNDCLYELYKVSGKIEYMIAAEKFDELPLFREIYNGNDVLKGKHANTTIPKFLGALNRYRTVDGDQTFYLDAAKQFFRIVTENHTYVTGGNSEWEHFGAPKMLAANLTNCNCETCNTYNMLKLARGLFSVTGEKQYLDFYEGTFWNAIVSSQNPKTGMSMYFQPMDTGYFKVFSRPFDNFWCCTGTGMENFTKLNDGIYYKKGNTIYVGMYIASELKDEELGVQISMAAKLPEDKTAYVAVEKTSEEKVVIAFRRPAWSRKNFTVSGSDLNLYTEETDGFVYVTIEQGFTEIEVEFAPEVMIHPLPDDPDMVAFTYGHLVLSAGLGKEAMEISTTGVNVTVPTREVKIKNTLAVQNKTVEEWKADPSGALVRQGNTLNFRLAGTDEDKNLIFSPHYCRFEERYGIYWKLTERKENTMPEKKDKKPKKGLMIALIAIVILLLALTGFFVAMELSPRFKAQVTMMFQGANHEHWAPTPTPTTAPDTAETPTPVPGEQTGILVTEREWTFLPDPEYAAAVANTQDLNGFTAFVEQIGGETYLSFSNGMYKISYKNGTESVFSHISPCEVIISNGPVTKRFAWNYQMDGEDFTCYAPRIGDYCRNGREQLVFAFPERKENANASLYVVAANNLMEYYVIEPKAALESLITVNGYLDAGKKMIADISSDGRYYYVALEHCLPELAETVYPVKADNKLTYEITDTDIILQSYVTLGEGNYIGRIRGNMRFSSRDVFRFTGSSFYLFAEDDYCDVDSTGIAEPIGEEELYALRIPVTGDAGERLLVRAQANIPLHNLDLNNFKKDEHGFLAYYENGIKKSMTGIDVSKWQNDINWKKVKAAGVDYAIIRLGYRGTAEAGNCAMDPMFEKNIKGALDAGLHVGVYYFTQAVTVEEAIEEANIVIDVLKDYKITFPVVYDTEYREDGRANDLSNAERTACAKAFCEAVLSAGYTPVVYSSTNWSVLDINMEELQNFDFWYAYYGEAEDIYLPYNFTMWQYTEKGRVDGISTDVDLNISFMDYSTR